MDFLNNQHGILYFLSIGAMAFIGLLIVFAFQMFIVFIISRFAFKYMIKFLSEVENRNLKNFNFTRKENREE